VRIAIHDEPTLFITDTAVPIDSGYFESSQ